MDSPDWCDDSPRVLFFGLEWHDWTWEIKKRIIGNLIKTNLVEISSKVLNSLKKHGT